MSARVYIRGIKGGDTEVLCEDVVTIGRDSTNLVVLDDAKTSRSHALIRRLGDGEYYLVDLGSANGTILDGKPLLMPRKLEHMDEIRIGDKTLVFLGEPEPKARKRETVKRTKVSARATLLDESLSVRETVNVTVIVIDLHDYTAMSGLIPFHLLGQVVSHWVNKMLDVAEENNGVMDKFIGDSVMLRWTTTPESETDNTVVMALKTALDANLATEQVNLDFPDLPIKLRIHCGLNCGLATFGAIGGRRGGDCTVLGDSVNVAFRLEKLTSVMDVDVAVGPDAYRQLPRACWKDNLKMLPIHGRGAPMEVCGLTFNMLAQWFASDESAANP